jgi:hypothetical protein
MSIAVTGRQIAAGPLLGWLWLAGAALVVAVIMWSVSAPTNFVLVIGPPVTAAMMCICTWFAAAACGRTRQLRASWIALAAALALQMTAMLVWRSWGTDLSMTMWIGLIALGFPTSVVLFGIDTVVHGVMPGRLADYLYPIGLLGLAYIQAFILLPRVFRWRAANGKEESSKGGR